MGVRPPADDGGGTRGVEFGIADVESRLSESSLSFPATGEEVVRALGDPDVAYDPSGSSVALSSVVERADRERFDSRREFLNALHPEFEALRTSRGAGLLGWVRSLFA